MKRTERREAMTAIKQFRESVGQTQEEFASIINVSKVNYSKKENGKVKFSLNEAFQIANHFNKPIEAIFGNMEVSKNEPL
jgi:putative transcriptional regulator